MRGKSIFNCVFSLLFVLFILIAIYFFYVDNFTVPQYAPSGSSSNGETCPPGWNNHLCKVDLKESYTKYMFSGDQRVAQSMINDAGGCKELFGSAREKGDRNFEACLSNAGAACVLTKENTGSGVCTFASYGSVSEDPVCTILCSPPNLWELLTACRVGADMPCWSCKVEVTYSRAVLHTCAYVSIGSVSD